ncbi:g7861 [Coccomyxa viridis]|uniref:G7861 protein n=1 Tax=Coccomyxa viridis TaxID=1274662 RepID=A0ABP1FYX1_9CHLO
MIPGLAANLPRPLKPRLFYDEDLPDSVTKESSKNWQKRRRTYRTASYFLSGIGTAQSPSYEPKTTDIIDMNGARVNRIAIDKDGRPVLSPRPVGMPDSEYQSWLSALLAEQAKYAREGADFIPGFRMPVVVKRVTLVRPPSNKLLNYFRGFRNCCSVRSVEYYQAPELLRLLVNVLPAVKAAASHPDRGTARWATVVRMEERKLAEAIHASTSRGQQVEEVLLLTKQYWEVENMLQGLRGHGEYKRLEGLLAAIHDDLSRYRPETSGGAVSTIQALVFLAGERIHTDNDSIPENTRNAVHVLKLLATLRARLDFYRLGLDKNLPATEAGVTTLLDIEAASRRFDVVWLPRAPRPGRLILDPAMKSRSYEWPVPVPMATIDLLSIARILASEYCRTLSGRTQVDDMYRPLRRQSDGTYREMPSARVVIEGLPGGQRGSPYERVRVGVAMPDSHAQGMDQADGYQDQDLGQRLGLIADTRDSRETGDQAVLAKAMQIVQDSFLNYNIEPSSRGVQMYNELTSFMHQQPGGRRSTNWRFLEEMQHVLMDCWFRLPTRGVTDPLIMPEIARRLPEHHIFFVPIPQITGSDMFNEMTDDLCPNDSMPSTSKSLVTVVIDVRAGRMIIFDPLLRSTTTPGSTLTVWKVLACLLSLSVRLRRSSSIMREGGVAYSSAAFHMVGQSTAHRRRVDVRRAALAAYEDYRGKGIIFINSKPAISKNVVLAFGRDEGDFEKQDGKDGNAAQASRPARGRSGGRRSGGRRRQDGWGPVRNTETYTIGDLNPHMCLLFAMNFLSTKRPGMYDDVFSPALPDPWIRSLETQQPADVTSGIDIMDTVISEKLKALYDMFFSSTPLPQEPSDRLPNFPARPEGLPHRVSGQGV